MQDSIDKVFFEMETATQATLATMLVCFPVEELEHRQQGVNNSNAEGLADPHTPGALPLHNCKLLYMC